MIKYQSFNYKLKLKKKTSMDENIWCRLCFLFSVFTFFYKKKKQDIPICLFSFFIFNKMKIHNKFSKLLKPKKLGFSVN